MYDSGLNILLLLLLIFKIYLFCLCSYVETAHSKEGTNVQLSVRGKMLPAQVRTSTSLISYIIYEQTHTKKQLIILTLFVYLFFHLVINIVPIYEY